MAKHECCSIRKQHLLGLSGSDDQEQQRLGTLGSNSARLAWHVAGRRQFRQQSRADVEAPHDRAWSAKQPVRHRAAHGAQADEGERGHSFTAPVIALT